MKNIAKLLFMVFVVSILGLNVSYAATDAELIQDVYGKITFYRGLLTGDITNDTKIAVDNIKNTVNLISDYDKKTALMQDVITLSNQMNDIITGKDLTTIAGKIKFVFEDGEMLLSLPDTASRYRFIASVSNADLGVEMFNMSASQNTKIPLQTLKAATNLKYNVQILYGATVIKTVTGTTKFTDTTRPVVTGIYTMGGKLYVAATDNYKLADQKNIFTVGTDVFNTNSYYDVDTYPTTVKVQVKDLFNNLSTLYTINVTEADKVYFGKVPSNVEGNINEARESNIVINKNFKNIVTGELGKELYYMDAFDTYFKKKVGNSYKTANMKLNSTTLKYDTTKKMVKLEKQGVYSIKFKYGTNETLINTYVVVGDAKGKITDYYEEVQDNIPNYYTNNTLYLKDYITLLPRSKYVDGGASNQYIIVMVDDVLYNLNSSLNVSTKKDWVINICNLATGEVINHELCYKKIEITTQILNDIKNSWARLNVISMIQKNIVKGYEDQTFKPELQVTVKEFISMLNRMNPNKKRQTLNNYYVGLSTDDWGYYEVKNVLSKIDYSALMSSGLMDKFDMPITREEVAFLLVNYYKIEDKATDKYFSDITTSRYPAEMQKLVAYGILTGYKDKTLKPTNFLTRAEAVTILSRTSGK